MKFKKQTQLLFSEFTKFSAVGSIATIIHFAVVWVLIRYHDWEPISSNLVAYAIAMTISLLGNYSWVYRMKTPFRYVIQKYLTISLGTLLTSTFFITLLKDTENLSNESSTLLSAGAGSVITFYLYRSFVFHQTKCG